MSSRPRRSAAKKASEALIDWADSERSSNMSTRARRSEGRTSGVSRGPPSSPGSEHLNLTVKVPANKLREATSTKGRNSTGNSISVTSARWTTPPRTRGVRKSYAVQSDSDEEEEEEEDEEMEDPNDEDAEGDEDDMDVDAEGEEEDAEGDVDMDTPAPTIKIQLPKAGKITPRRPAAARVIEDDDDDDEEELSEIEVSDPENTMNMSIDVGGAGDDDEDDDDAEGEEEDAEGEEEDAEGEEEEIEVADETQGPDAEGEEELDSEDGSREGSPDLSKMTRRQRARFEDEPQQYMKLSDEVQAKKVFTAEELSMRRAEMARRRRNLSEKRNEEVKMETINKLLKKQAPKTKGKGQATGDETPGNDPPKPDVAFVRWVSSKKGSIIAVPDEMLGAPVGKVFIPGGLKSGKMVEEVA
ncbi:PAPA-1-like conserved region family protein [Colletotrichum sojae]|uniref:PAPA-1-like conserved region family protein n=1 Tax=Colletotrichum sojae TaxID=2175907 RepID=A0A8H6JZ04_9PEZI|nr:PAPA-1-like conserved region family protein [Colletotrichum sojae]